MTHILCMYFPKWPLQRLLFDRPELRDKAVVVASPRARRGPAVSLSSTLAAKAGIRPGMPVAEALAIQSTVHVEEENPRRDRQVLHELAHWAERFSPIVGLEEAETAECLLLDVAGCAAFFRGEDRLLRRAHEEIRRKGWFARVALAGTVGAAWALAHFADTRCLVESAETEAALRP